MGQDNLAGRLATKRKLGFLKTFDKRIEGLIREKERLLRALRDPDAPGSAAWLDNVESIIRGFVGAGPVYGINAVSDWAKSTLAQVARRREMEADPNEEDLLWLSSITQEIKLLHSEAMSEIEEKFGVASIQETPSVIPPGTDTGLQSRSTLPPDDKTAANPPPSAPTRVAKLPLRQGAPDAPIGSPAALPPEANQITPITEDDIVTSVPDEVGASSKPAPPAFDDLLDAGHTEVMPDRPRFSAPRVDTLPPSMAAPPPKPPRASGPQPPRPSNRQPPRSSSPQLPRPSSSPRPPVQVDAEAALREDPSPLDGADAARPGAPSVETPAKDKDSTIPLSSGDLHQLPDDSFVESAPRAAGGGSFAGLTRPWAVAMGITWIALLISLYFNWRGYLAEPSADEGYVRAVGESARNQGPSSSGATDVSGIVPRIAIREAPVSKAEPDASAKEQNPPVTADAAAAELPAKAEPPKEAASAAPKKPDERVRRRSGAEKKEPSGEPSEDKLPSPKSAPALSPSDSSGLLSVLVPPNAAGPVSIEVDKRARGIAPIKIKLGPGLHELVQSYQGKRSMRIVLIRAGKTKIITAKIPD